jgi:hypothetical protein
MPNGGLDMNLQLDHAAVSPREERKRLWNDNLVWWVNCLAIERYWFYAGRDLEIARGRRDAMLNALLENA